MNRQLLKEKKKAMINNFRIMSFLNLVSLILNIFSIVYFKWYEIYNGKNDNSYWVNLLIYHGDDGYEFLPNIDI